MYMVAKRTPRAYDLYIVSALLSPAASAAASGTACAMARPSVLGGAGRAVLPAGARDLLVVASVVADRRGRLRRRVRSSRSSTRANIFSFSNQRWVAAAPAVILFGSILAAQTVMRSKKAALLGLAAMGLSLTALAFRTYDLTVCDSFPMGTHWLWHMFNSAGGFTAMLAIITLQTQGAAKRQPQPVGEAAE